ncbi:MAG TPA: M14 family zinc carboxypeptidase [Planctomycetota bacterium]|nr:M14 family zinc carboxypeptidase [Planctomycetota bacterium]
MKTRSAILWLARGLAALALACAPLGLLAAEDAPPAEAPGEKEPPKEKGKEPLRIRRHEAGHVVGISVKDEAVKGDLFEVRRGSRLVAYAEVTEVVKYWPKLTYLVGAGHADDELFPLVAPVPCVQLLTDERDAPETKELKALLGDRLIIEELGDKITIHSQCTARIVVLHGGIFFMGGDPIAEPFARKGGTVIVDTLAWSHIKGEVADEMKFKEPTTLRIVREEGFTAGFPAESRVPWYGTRKAKQFLARYIAGLPKQDGDAKLLATDHSGENSALLDVALGGRLAVMDLITPTGRAGRDPGAKNKLVFLARVLGSGPRYARYLPSKPEYDDLLRWFDDLTDKHKPKMTKAFEGGAQKEDYLYGYTIGAKDKPLVVLAAGLQGTAWLGPVALNRLAEVLLENPESDPKIDWLLERVRVKLLPLLNPHGYRANAAPNENGVELDRNFAYHWDEFADAKARGKQPFSEAGSSVVQRCVEKEKAIAFLDVGVDDYDAGYRIVRARDGSAAQQGLLYALVAIVNARLKHRFVVGDKMLQLRVTRDAERPSASNWAGSTGALAASLRICGDGEDSITNVDVAVESCLHFLYATALSREKPEPEPEPPPRKAIKAPKKAADK